jgi:hypothetical protein
MKAIKVAITLIVLMTANIALAAESTPAQAKGDCPFAKVPDHSAQLKIVNNILSDSNGGAISTTGAFH